MKTNTQNMEFSIGLINGINDTVIWQQEKKTMVLIAQ